MNAQASHLRAIRRWLAIFIIGLVASGLTAFATQTEVEWLAAALGVPPTAHAADLIGLRAWIATVRDGLQQTNAHYPFIAYGTDWLAFGHLAIAVFFVGPLIDPERNRWVIDAGLITCAGVLPLALSLP
jgi:hypothetical protein